MNEPGDLDAEIRATRGEVLGEAVWRRFCIAADRDPKEELLRPWHSSFVQIVQACLMAMEESGFEGLEDWLQMEEDAR